MKTFNILVFGFLFSGCANDDVRRGAAGEFCNGRDTDCRSGLICANELCLSAPSENGCEQICAKIRECGNSIAGCDFSCSITIDSWSTNAKEVFGECVVNDLTCIEVENAFAPQTCYERIPIDEDRQNTCASLIRERRECGFSDPDGEFTKACNASARVDIASEFQKTEVCLSENRTCDGLQQCLSMVF